MLFLLGGGSLLSAAERVTVVKIIDGDTIGVLYRGRYEKVRLIGIDTPESRRNSRAYRQAQGSAADVEYILRRGKAVKSYVKGLLRRDMIIFIEFDVQQRDRYRRLLAYLYLQNGEMLNEKLLREGYASLLTVPPNVLHRDRFLKIYRKAQQKEFRGY